MLFRSEFTIHALPIRAYVKIWNEFFRDENVDNAAVVKTDDADVSYEDSSTDNINVILQVAYKGGRCLPVNKFHDYFTSCLPYPQRGPAVTLPMEGNAPLKLGNENGTPIPALETGVGPEMVVGVTQSQSTPGTLVYAGRGGPNKKSMQFSRVS